MSAVTITQCAGLWRRTLLVGADGSRDTSTSVLWLQGITVYVDSRGFAGVLHQHGDVFGWRRDVDLDPSGPHPDEGVMRWDGEMLIETGVHENYVEHWVREDRPTVPAGAQFVTAADGTAGLLVWVGDTFGWAGGGEVGIDTGGGRWNALAAGSAGDQLDVDGMSWHIERTEGTAYP